MLSRSQASPNKRFSEEGNIFSFSEQGNVLRFGEEGNAVGYVSVKLVTYHSLFK